MLLQVLSGHLQGQGVRVHYTPHEAQIPAKLHSLIAWTDGICECMMQVVPGHLHSQGARIPYALQKISEQALTAQNCCC